MSNHIYLFVTKSLVRNQILNHKIPYGKVTPFYNVVSKNTFKQKKGGGMIYN